VDWRGEGEGKVLPVSAGEQSVKPRCVCLGTDLEHPPAELPLVKPDLDIYSI
jgi:hypothetical protein